MKTIATLATTILLSLGVFIAPASADEPPVSEPTCEESVQEWRTRALTAEADLVSTRAELDGTRTLLSWYVDSHIAHEAANVRSAQSALRLVRIAERRREKIAELREVIRELRELRGR